MPTNYTDSQDNCPAATSSYARVGIDTRDANPANGAGGVNNAIAALQFVRNTREAILPLDDGGGGRSVAAPGGLRAVVGGPDSGFHWHGWVRLFDTVPIGVVAPGQDTPAEVTNGLVVLDPAASDDALPNQIGVGAGPLGNRFYRMTAWGIFEEPHVLDDGTPSPPTSICNLVPNTPVQATKNGATTDIRLGVEYQGTAGGFLSAAPSSSPASSGGGLIGRWLTLAVTMVNDTQLAGWLYLFLDAAGGRVMMEYQKNPEYEYRWAAVYVELEAGPKMVSP